MASQVELMSVATPRRKILGLAANEQLNLRHRTRIGEEIIRVLLIICGIISIFTTIGIVVVLVRDALGFFNGSAWVLVNAQVPAETSSLQLAESLDPQGNIITFNLDADAATLPLADRQFILVDNEIMQVVSRGRRTFTVARAQDNTAAAAHTANAVIYPMTANQVKLLNAITPEDTVIQLPPAYSKEFRVGDELHIGEGSEVLRITAIDGDMLTVARGYQNTTPVAHTTDESLFKADRPGIIEFFTSQTWQPQIGEFGILPLLSATLVTSIIGLLVAIPIGLSAAIYLSEYAPRRVRNILKPIIEILAGIPTVVFGFFALTLITPVLQSIFPGQVQNYNVLSAGLVLGILITPIVSTMTEDAISAVPRSLREASMGLGATRLETVVKVVLPAAISGILAAIIVAASRAIGETMVVAIAAGSGPAMANNLFAGAETMTGHIARISGGDLGQEGNIQYDSIFVIGLLLFTMTLTLNIASNWVSRRLRERY